MRFTPYCLNPETPRGRCTSEGFVSSLGKPSASKCSCPSWPLGDKGTALLHFLLCTSNTQSPLPPAELYLSLQGLLLPEKGFWKRWYILCPDYSPQEEGWKGLGRLELSACSVCQVLCRPRGRGLPLDRALCVCCVKGQIGASGHTVKSSTRPSLPEPASQSLVKSPPEALSPAVHLGLWLPPAENSLCCASWQPLSPLNPKLEDPDLCVSTLVSEP